MTGVWVVICCKVVVRVRMVHAVHPVKVCRFKVVAKVHGVRRVKVRHVKVYQEVECEV